MEARAESSRPRHEIRDADIRSLVWWGLGVLALLAFGVIASAIAFRFFVTHQSLGPPASPFENARALPPAPRLQVTPAQDLKDYLDRDQQALSAYGWVDQKAGILRIPIDRAMDILLQKGFPVERNAQGNPGANTKAISDEAAPRRSPDPAMQTGTNRQ